MTKTFLGMVTAALLATMAGVVIAEETKGTIKSVDSNRNEVVIKGLVKDSVYEVSKDAYVCLDGVRAKIADLRDTDRVVIVYDKKGDHLIASEVRGLRAAQEATGTVRSTFAEKKEVTIKGLVKDTTYELNKGGTVLINGKEGSIKDIREGDNVWITYQQKGDHMMAACVRAERR
jgi:hypothetical protein